MLDGAPWLEWGARGLDEAVDGFPSEEHPVAAGRDVLGQRMGDVAVDVVLRGLLVEADRPLRIILLGGLRHPQPKVAE